MGTHSGIPFKNHLPLLACVGLGAIIGAAFAMRMDEESRRRVQKALFELGELPYRIFI